MFIPFAKLQKKQIGNKNFNNPFIQPLDNKN